MKIIGRFLSALAILAWSAGAFAQAPNFPLNSMVPNSAGGGGGSTSLAISSTPITGGTNTRVLFDDSGTVGEDAGLTYNKATDALAIVGSVAIGTASSATGQLTLANSASAFLTTIQAGNAAAARTYTWPTNFGAAGTVLTDAAGNGTLSWAAPASGLTIGTTAITSGTTTRILYDNAGVVGEYTLTGTGTVVAMQTAPTFLTSITHGVGPAILTSPAAASTQIGAADVASGAVAQTLTFQGNTGAATTGPVAIIKGAAGGSGSSVGGILRLQGGTPTAGIGGVVEIYTSATTTPALAATFGIDKTLTTVGSVVITDSKGVYFGGGSYGIFRNSGVDGGIVQFINNNTFVGGFGAASLIVARDNQIGFLSTTTLGQYPDTLWARISVGVISQGGAGAAVPVAQTYQAQGSRAGTDSNVGGANFTITSGNGTGTGTLSTVILKSPIAVASGTGAQTMTTGLTISNGAAVTAGYTVATLPAAATAGGRAHVTDQLTTCAVTGAALTGGGAVTCPAFYNGSAWVGGFLYMPGVFAPRGAPANDNDPFPMQMVG